jgi:MSHA biogenesis protein MshI
MMSFPRLQALFANSKGGEGWLAARIRADELLLVHAARTTTGKPIVTLCEAFPLTDFKAAGHFNRYLVSCLLNAEEYQLFSSEAPPVPKVEMKQAVRWKIKDLLDYAIEEAAVDLLDIPGDRDGKGKSLIVVAARNETIREKMRLFSEMGLPLAAIDIPEVAQRNIATLMEGENKAIAMLSISEEGGLLTFSCKGELYLARRIDAPLKFETGEEGEKQRERITLELQRSLDYFDRQYHTIALSRLVLAPFSGAEGVLEYLSSNLYVPVQMTDLNELFEFPEPLSQDEQSRYFPLLGGALREAAS